MLQLLMSRLPVESWDRGEVTTAHWESRHYTLGEHCTLGEHMNTCRHYTLGEREITWVTSGHRTLGEDMDTCVTTFRKIGKSGTRKSGHMTIQWICHAVLLQFFFVMRDGNKIPALSAMIKQFWFSHCAVLWFSQCAARLQHSLSPAAILSEEDFSGHTFILCQTQ